MTAIAHDFHLPIRDEATLKEFIRVAFGVVIPDKQVCERHTTPWRAFADAYFAKHPVSVWFASRGFGGKSFLLSLLGTIEGATLGASASILGGSGAQSQRVNQYINELWTYKNAPSYLLVSDPSKREVKLSNGSRIEALMASQTSVRGAHPQRLRADEIDEMDIAILDAAMGQPMASKGIPAQTVFSSTRQYANGTMQEILKRAGEKGWGVYEWCYKENLEPHGWLSEAEVERKKNEVTSVMWQTEYENQEPNPSSRAIQPAAVERLFDKSLGEFIGHANEYIEIESPQKGARYVHGADWARKTDWTIIVTYRSDVYPVRCVAWERTGRLDWHVMVGKLDARLKRYGGSATHDGTGLGDVVKDIIQHPAEAFIMAGRSRADLLSEYITACEKGDLVYPFIKYAYDEHRFAGVEDVFSGGEKHHLPDTISAGALGWHSARKVDSVINTGLNPFADYRG
jgi:hypothetical protein